MSTLTRDKFKHPDTLARPNFRNFSASRFDNTDNLRRPQTAATVGSGYTTALNLFDGKGWLNKKNLHGDNIHSEYRDRFNQDKPFHKTFTRFADHQMK